LKTTALCSVLAGAAVVLSFSGAAAEQAEQTASALDTTQAQESAETPIEEIITLGTRSKGRTALETAVPVDVINTQDIQSTGGTETGRVLQMIAPSFNFSSSSISDGTDAVRPATLRGLGPDQTLVLVNGKRRHTSALINVNTSVGRGSAGVDMNAIPPSAIGRIEVLRDGAAAQYGSDAIAGVINIVLRDQNDGGDASVYWGQTYEGDGDVFVANTSYGLEIGDGGFLTLTGEYRNRQNTNRAGLTGAVQYELIDGQLDPREATFNRRNFRIGDSDSEQGVAVINMGVPLSDNAKFYLFGTYSNRDNQSAGFYRRQNQVNRTVVELYPDGFLPLINSNIKDKSLAAGITWTLGEWDVDTSVSTGNNSFNFVISNSLNASFGPNSPTKADAGTLKIYQTTLNLDVARTVFLNDIDINLAFGAERRQEKYKIIAGEPVSYANGGAVNTNCNGCNPDEGGTPVPYAAGFQVFRGFSPDNALSESRNNWAVYLDLESNITDRLLVDGAVRYEEYSDFGSTFNAKLAARFDLTGQFAVRGSVSTGFRAPSMQQLFFNSTSTQFVEIGGVTVAQERGTFRNDSAVARALGIPKLKEETALNFSGGFVATLLDGLTITADYYHISIDDRIVISGSIPIATQFPDVTAATGATAGQFFTNIADTRTQGVDFVATYGMAFDNDSDLKLSLAANWTDTKIKPGTIKTPLPGVSNTTLFTAQDRSIIEEWQPSSRINFTSDYRWGAWTSVLRLSYFGTYTVCEGSCDTPSGPGQNIQKFGSKLLTDLQINYAFANSGLVLSIGGNNLFNVHPDLNLIGQARGGTIPGIVSSPGVFKYSRRSAPFGFNGGFYYAKIRYNF